MPTYASKFNRQRMICLNNISHAHGSGHTLFKAGLRECSSEDGRYFEQPIYYWLLINIVNQYCYK